MFSVKLRSKKTNGVLAEVKIKGSGDTDLGKFIKAKQALINVVKFNRKKHYMTWSEI